MQAHEGGANTALQELLKHTQGQPRLTMKNIVTDGEDMMTVEDLIFYFRVLQHSNNHDGNGIDHDASTMKVGCAKKTQCDLQASSASASAPSSSSLLLLLLLLLPLLQCFAQCFGDTRKLPAWLLANAVVKRLGEDGER